MVQYDPKIIYEFANRLYRQANTIIATYTIAFSLIGIVVVFITRDYIRNSVIEIFLVIILVAIGFYVGREKAFALKLQAQTALCQVKIEENTRK